MEGCLPEVCAADCNSCRKFPVAYRRVGESPFCRFLQYTMASGAQMPFPSDRMARILFLESGSLRLEDGDGNKRRISSGQFVCLARGTAYVVTATANLRVVVLTLHHRIEFSEQDIYDRDMPRDTAVTLDAIPMLKTHAAINRLIAGLFEIPAMTNCARYHRIKTAELFMMIKVLYSSLEHAYFFQSMIQSQDNFRIFVCNNYDKASNVADLAELAGMSLSVFKRRFAEHFNDSVYHWMMRQKALKIFADIRDGEDNIKVLMSKYDFTYYTQFSRFCKNYLQATPAQLIASIKGE